MRSDYTPLDINPVFPGLGEIIIIIIIIIITTMFNVISHRAEILVSLAFAVRADINKMSNVSQQYPFLVT